jgi:putative transposase
MARQWRIEYPNALYHVTSRGNGGQNIYFSDQDHHQFLTLIEEMAERFCIEIYAYVLMDNHYLCGAPHKKCYVKFQIM